MVRALFPGTFDPIHYGHIDIASRAAKVFDEIVMAVYDKPLKSLLFSPEERISLVSEAFKNNPKIKVTGYSGLTIDFARAIDAQVIVRGLRVFSDFEFVNPNADAFQVGFSIKQESKQSKGVFVILPSENDNLHRITTISESGFWHHTVQKLVKKSYPDLMPVFFKQNEIRDALLGFEKSLGNNFQLRIVDTTFWTLAFLNRAIAQFS